MKKFIKYYSLEILIIFSFLGFNESIAQVQVILQQPPPYKFLIEDMWKLTLINSSAAQEVYLYGTIEDLESNELLVEGTSPVFLLPQGVKNVSYSDVTPVDLKKTQMQ